MPITGQFALQPITQDEFARLDYEVMRLAFACQNDLGRLCEEAIYQTDMAARLQAAGVSAEKEVPVTAAYRDFSKTYSLDLVVAHAGIYELKTASSLVGAHESQLLHYLFLSGSHHGKLLNFRAPRVESRFVNAPSTPQERRQFSFDLEAWRESDASERVFRECLLGMLHEWGGWLDVELYTEALIHFAGGPGAVVQRLPLIRDGAHLGTQSFHLLNPATAFRITALTEGLANYEQQLRALLRVSPLRTLHWVNLGRKNVRLVSLTR